MVVFDNITATRMTISRTVTNIRVVDNNSEGDRAGSCPVDVASSFLATSDQESSWSSGADDGGC